MNREWKQTVTEPNQAISWWYTHTPCIGYDTEFSRRKNAPTAITYLDSVFAFPITPANSWVRSFFFIDDTCSANEFMWLSLIGKSAYSFIDFVSIILIVITTSETRRNKTIWCVVSAMLTCLPLAIGCVATLWYCVFVCIQTQKKNWNFVADIWWITFISIRCMHIAHSTSFQLVCSVQCVMLWIRILTESTRKWIRKMNWFVHVKAISGHESAEYVLQCGWQFCKFSSLNNLLRSSSDAKSQVCTRKSAISIDLLFDCISFCILLAFCLPDVNRNGSQHFLDLKSESNIWTDCHVIMQVRMKFLLRVLCVCAFFSLSSFVVVSAIQAKPIEKCTLFHRRVEL